ncbi:MAG: hypothetical protein ACK40D_15520 [Cyanobacteriota bacterium]|jgi:hypothetical protein
MARKEKTVEDLIAELEGHAPSAKAAPLVKPGAQAARLASASPGSGVRWLMALALLALGFGAGWTAAGLRPPAQGAATTTPGMETRQGLLSAGWQETDQGVFTRRCSDNCRPPFLYGGGIADVMEVNCLERPCGQIRAEFAVLDGRGQLIDQFVETRSGRKGERLQLVLESQLPAARRFLLQSFSAKARID